MSDSAQPSMLYPIYIPSRSRFQPKRRYTIKALMKYETPFRVVVVPEEADAYREVVGEERVLVLPDNDHVLRDARNWIKEHATAEGHKRHWQLDDNIVSFRRFYNGRRIPCDPAMALGTCEQLTDRYTNVAISGLDYSFNLTHETRVPFRVNTHVYSCSLILNEIPNRWRLVYNDDTDMCLQVLADNWCTINVCAFVHEKKHTSAVRGGNTDALYQGDGRLLMAETLRRQWPHVVKVIHRWGRPQHSVNWLRFKQPLIRREDIDFGALPEATEDGIVLRAVREPSTIAMQRIFAARAEQDKEADA